MTLRSRLTPKPPSRFFFRMLSPRAYIRWMGFSSSCNFFWNSTNILSFFAQCQKPRLDIVHEFPRTAIGYILSFNFVQYILLEFYVNPFQVVTEECSVIISPRNTLNGMVGEPSPIGSAALTLMYSLPMPLTPPCFMLEVTTYLSVCKCV